MADTGAPNYGLKALDGTPAISTGSVTKDVDEAIREGMKHPDAHSAATVAQRPLKSGQQIGTLGTTVYNINPSSLEYEAMHGEKRYKTKQIKDSPAQLLQKQQGLESQVATLTESVKILTAALANKTAEAKTPEGYVTHPVGNCDVSPVITTNEPEIVPHVFKSIPIDYFTWNYHALKKECKELGLDNKGKKDKLIERLIERSKGGNSTS